MFLAVDGDTGSQVAVKKLFRIDAQSVRRLKREFRALTDLHHPNLVKLYDLVHGGDAWLLTMEFVDGSDLQARLLRRNEPLAARLPELLSIFHQLACGVQALHRAGLMHRDLKPSNVMVARDGRVVLLDFGLVRDLAADGGEVTQEGMITGTPAYMPPEQARALPLSEASDWYAFGVMLYEALSGELPIDGRTLHELLRRKLSDEPPPLSAAKLGVPHELVALCTQLLAREPSARPSGAAVLELLTGLQLASHSVERTVTETLSMPVDGVLRQARLVGRDAELAQLRAAASAAWSGTSVAAFVSAPSGEGKSALIEQFLAELERLASGPAVLRSRCYEREATPFKALDGVVEGLVSHLSTLDELQLANVLPQELPELMRLFPALERLKTVQRLTSSARPHPDPARARRRAEEGLRTLICNVARLRPLALWIDDLQWGDLDSASVLRDWLECATGVPLLLVFSFRSDEAETSACLRAMALPDAAHGCEQVRIALSPLSEADIRVLCSQRLAANTPHDVASRIVEEARGNPFLALQLIALAHAKLARNALELSDISISELVLRARALLPERATALLDVLAAAGRPLSPQLALSAADVSQDGRAHIHALQGLRLLRSRVVAGTRLLEVYHDRVREAVQASWDAVRRAHIHGQLYAALESMGKSDHDWLHELAFGAELLERALHHGLLAAERAEAGFAFERAIVLYRRCLGLSRGKEQQATLWTRLARVLAQSRQGAQAADAYLAAAQLVAADAQLPLLQLAASHMLRTGRFAEGEALVQRVLSAERVSVPSTELGLYAAVGWERARLALRGQRFTPAEPALLLPEVKRRFQLYTELAVETQFFAPLRAALFQARAMRIAMDSGDRVLIARGLCLTATVMCLAGTPRAARHTARLLDRAETLLREVDIHELRSELYCARTLCNFLLGQMHDAVRVSEAALQVYQTERGGGEQGDYYYLFALLTARMGALQVLGRFREAERELGEVLTRAAATGNRTAVLQVSFVRVAIEQALDQGHASRPRLDRERHELPEQGIGVLHVLHLIAVLWTAGLTGEYAWARSVMELYWERCLHSPVRHGRVLRNFMHTARARLLLNEYVAGGRLGDPAEVIREDLRVLDAMRGTVRIDPSKRYHARIAYLRGDKSRAQQLLQQFWQELSTAGVAEEAERERYAIGFLMGGEEGAQLRAAAHASSLALGVVNPLALLRGTYPEIVQDGEGEPRD